MPRVSRRKWYERANAAWPAGPLPKLTTEEAVRAAKKLYRFVFGKAWKGAVQVTSGRNHNSMRDGLTVNPGHGWNTMVHELSHWFDWRRRGSDSGHDAVHARLERRMINVVVRRGWLDDKLKSLHQRIPKDSVAHTRYQSVLRRINEWTRKLRRAETALKKLKKQQRYYERQAALVRKPRKDTVTSLQRAAERAAAKGLVFTADALTERAVALQREVAHAG